MGCLGRESNPGPSKSSMLALPLSHTMAISNQPVDSQDLSDADLIAEAIEGRGEEDLHSADANIEFHNLNSEEQDIQQLLVEKAEFLEVLGWASGSKGEGITRLIFENPNRLPARLTGNKKLDNTKTVINDLEGDFYGFSEHRNHLKHQENRRHGINQLFNGGESLVRGVLAHNKHEKIEKYLLRRTQEGGTGAVSFGELASLMNRNNSGCDSRTFCNCSRLGKETESASL